MGYVHFLNGKFVTEDKLLISPRDLGYARGYAVFDFFVTYTHHKPFKLSEHIDRLFTSAHHIGLTIPWTKKQIIDWVHQTLEKNTTPDEKMVKVIVSGGISDSLMPKTKPTIVIMVDPRAIYPKEFYTKGVNVITHKYKRYTPLAKTNHYIEAVKQVQHAQKSKALEPLYYDDTQVFEGSTMNVFAVIDGILKTPKSHILAGITRNTLLEILKLNTPISVEDFTIEELRSAQEVFLSSSNREITPVTLLDGKRVGDGTVGPITQEVMKQFREYTESNIWNN